MPGELASLCGLSRRGRRRVLPGRTHWRIVRRQERILDEPEAIEVDGGPAATVEYFPGSRPEFSLTLHVDGTIMDALARGRVSQGKDLGART